MPPRKAVVRRLSLSPAPAERLPAHFKGLLPQEDLAVFSDEVLSTSRVAGRWVLLTRTNDNDVFASQGLFGFRTTTFSSTGRPLVKLMGTAEHDGSLISSLVPLSSCFPGDIPLSDTEPGQMPRASDLRAFLASGAFAFTALIPTREVQLLISSREAFTVYCSVPEVRGTQLTVPTALPSPVRAGKAKPALSNQSSSLPLQQSVISIPDTAHPQSCVTGQHVARRHFASKDRHQAATHVQVIGAKYSYDCWIDAMSYCGCWFLHRRY
jgi:hypothetical protein